MLQVNQGLHYHRDTEWVFVSPFKNLWAGRHILNEFGTKVVQVRLNAFHDL
jgi:hypothetical protein